MQTLSENPTLATLPKPQIVFSDFDGTLTDHTEFSSTFLDIMALLAAHQTPLVIVTGRSLSWAHFLLTHFSTLDHVIAEGGGVHAYRDERGFIQHKNLVSDETVAQLARITDALSNTLPTVNLSADSLGRLTDRAIELEDLHSNPKLRQDVEHFLQENGAHFSTSNVHLNFWCGDIDKFTAMEYFLTRYYPQAHFSDCLFFGDSLNDQSVFQHMDNSIGVANIADVAEQLTHKPRVILTNPEHSGPRGVLHVLEHLIR